MELYCGKEAHKDFVALFDWLRAGIGGEDTISDGFNR